MLSLSTHDLVRKCFIFQKTLDIIDKKSFLCKNFQMVYTSDDYVKDLIHQINPEFDESYTMYGLFNI